MSQQRAKKHHHGDLREALIKAGIELLSQGGLPALTLRACAAQAGVSHAAPAHHFQGLPGLLAAISARGFQLFTRSMVQARDNAGNTPYQKLQGICVGYLQFATTHKALFTLIFNANVDFSLDSDLQLHSTEAYQVLADTCAPFNVGNDAPERLEVTVWSLVHGFANLMLMQRTGVFDHLAKDFGFNEVLANLNLNPKLDV